MGLEVGDIELGVMSLEMRKIVWLNEIILVEFRGRKEERRGSGRVLRFGNI